MRLSLGLILILILIVLPGGIYRRSYYTGEFSKQFNTKQPIVQTVATAILPGLILLLITVVCYDLSINEINIVGIVNLFKQINTPTQIFNKDAESIINNIIYKEAPLFIAYLYLWSILLGIISKWCVRALKLDSRLKILRYKNIWFYLFYPDHIRLRKMKHLNPGQDKKYLFTRVDILIDTLTGTRLYSGIVLDYEVDEDNNEKLSKVFLQEATRYSKDTNDTTKTIPKLIPGRIFVVDCQTMKNINLIHIFEKSTEEQRSSFLESKIPYYIDIVFGLLILILIPFIFFRITFLNWHWYETFFSWAWYARIIAYLLFIQIFNLLN